MGISNKRKGVMPTFPYRWQNIATDPRREKDAIQMYRDENKNATLVQAYRSVSQFRNQLKRDHGWNDQK